MRISRSTSQAFSLEVEEEMEEDVTQEDIEDIKDAIEELLFLVTE
ncbi:MAG: hypothetical protein OXC18_07655 [Desulfurellaceae bacterium]|nr:hypothetical protein [Desulfurellaceae bacterium]